MGRREEAVQYEWVCGNCKENVLYTTDEEPPSECPTCGWIHDQREFRDVPRRIRMRIHQ